MSFLSGVKRGAQSAVSAASRQAVPSAAKASKPPDAAAVKDAFEQLPRPKVELSGGCTLTFGAVSVGQTAKGGSSISTSALKDTVGVSFKVTDGPATLGSVGVKAGGRELVIGLVPAAPHPIPVPLYAGEERKD